MSATAPVAQRQRARTQPGRPAPRARYRTGFWLVGFVFLVTMAFSAVPAPLYVLYAARDRFGPLMITVIFAAYAVGVIASLFLAGHLSDWLGRRRMAVTAVAVNVASGVIFLLWPSVPGLLTARVVSGVSVGMLTATATAYLSELDAAGRGGMPRRRAEIIATAANLGGIGLGPLVAGFLAQYAGDPLAVPYLVFEALMLAGLLALALVPETVTRPRPRPRYRPQRVSVPARHRQAFYAASAAAAAEFALFGLFTSLAPGFIAGTLHDTSHALAGAATFAVFGAAALAQIVASRLALRSQLAFGLLALVLGADGHHRGVLAGEPGAVAGRGDRGRERGRRRVQGQRDHGAGHRPAAGPRRGARRPLPGRVRRPGRPGRGAGPRDPAAVRPGGGAGVRGTAGGGGRPGQQAAAEDLSGRLQRVCPRSLGWK